MAFGRNRAPIARTGSPPGAPRTDARWAADDWMQPLPVPDVKEGGESMWDAWNEESQRMDLAFADTQPSDLVPLTPATPKEQRLPGRSTAADVIALARRNNRVCPRAPLWSALYALLEGEHYADLRPPPTQAGVWASVSNLQRRLQLREHIEWAARHGRLEDMASFLESLAEPDWVHMGDG